jgi:hypothetical protein
MTLAREGARDVREHRVTLARLSAQIAAALAAGLAAGPLR